MVEILKLMHGQDLKRKFDQDLCKNHSTRSAFGNILSNQILFLPSLPERMIACNMQWKISIGNGWMDCSTDESLDEKMNKWISEYDLMNVLKTDQRLMHKI